MKNPLKQSAGVALVTVLLVVAAATIAAVSISVRQQVDIRRTESLLRSDQALLHALGVEMWAKGRLDELAKAILNDPTLAPVSRNGEEWEIVMRNDGSVEGGDVVGKLIDQQGRFNLNNLVEDPNPNQNQNQNLRSSAKWKTRFIKLLTVLEVNDAESLANALTDWLDTDSDIIGMGGAEDVHYQSIAKPYRAANRLMAHPSELLLVKEFTLDIYRKLIRHVTALPALDTKINVNTASEKVLESVLTGIDSQGVYQIITTRDAVAYTNMDAVKNVQAGVDYSGADIKSDYFSVVAGATVGKAKVALISLLEQKSAVPGVQGPPGKVIILNRMREDVLELEDMY